MAKIKPEHFIKRRQALALSQEALAEALGVTRRSVVRWENGKIEIPRLADLALECLVLQAKKK